MSEESCHFVSLAEAADMLGICERSVSNLHKKKLLRRRVFPGCRKGHYVREDVQKLIDFGLKDLPDLEERITLLMKMEL